MIIIKFKKTGPAAFIPHLDTIRTFMRILTRAKISVNFSSGFNPHMCLYFSNPIPLGLETVAEYCTIDADILAKEFIEKFNFSSIDGIECLDAKNISQNPNFAAILCAAAYEFEIDGLKNYTKIIDSILGKPFIINYKSKGLDYSRDFSLMVKDIKQDNDILKCVFSTGQNNLRHDIFANEILRLTGLCKINKILKTSQFYLDKNNLSNADNLFK